MSHNSQAFIDNNYSNDIINLSNTDKEWLPRHSLQTLEKEWEQMMTLRALVIMNRNVLVCL
jgi:uncharacterized membrane protein YukC